MQAINHVVFGSLVAVIIREPALAVPISLGSHFVMDAIPHYGDDPKAPRGSKQYNLRIVADAIACILVLLLFVSLHPPNTMLLITCAVVAASPDFIWPLALYIKQKGPLWAFFKFHKNIQRESRTGIYLEIVWLALTSTLVIYKIR